MKTTDGFSPFDTISSLDSGETVREGAKPPGYSLTLV